MNNKTIIVDGIKNLIPPCSGFAKKRLADYKLDLLALCEFGCPYCSTNHGNYLRIRKKNYAAESKRQLGERLLPALNPELTIHWRDVLKHLEEQLDGKPKSFGLGRTLVFSMLTDGFSPSLVRNGTTAAALKLVLGRTSFRIRVLTKNAVVGTDDWIRLFLEHPGRFVVGLSIGSLDDGWAKKMELGTSAPTARIHALRRLQDAGIPTFGMLCPVFPEILDSGALEALVEQSRPDRVEHVWAEPYNDRANWKLVRSIYPAGSASYAWMTEVYGHKDAAVWSKYVIDLYLRLHAIAEKGGWMPKLRYLLYEDLIVPDDAARLPGLNGILVQSKPGDDGFSKNSHIRALEMKEC